MKLLLREARLDLREDGAEGRRGEARELWALGEFGARGRGAGEAAEETRDLPRGRERGVFLEDQRADFLGVGVGEWSDGCRGQRDLCCGIAGAAEVAVAAIILRESFAEIADQPARDAAAGAREVEDLREALRVAGFALREKFCLIRGDGGGVALRGVAAEAEAVAEAIGASTHNDPSEDATNPEPH